MKKHCTKPVDPLFLPQDIESQAYAVKGQTFEHQDRLNFNLCESENERNLKKTEEN